MRRVLKWLGASVATFLSLLLLIGIGLYYFNWNWARGYIDREGTQLSGRTFAIDGDVRVNLRHLWTPEIHIEKIRIGNPPWAKQPNLVEIGALDFKIELQELWAGRIVLPELTLEQPNIDLEKPDKDRNNWSLSTATPGGAAVNTTVPKNRTQVPVIGQLVVRQGTLRYADGPSRLSVTSKIDTAFGTGGKSREQMIRLQSQGTIQGKPFNLNAQGGSLLTLRDPKTKYPLNVELKAGPTVFSAKGTMTDPVQMAGIDMRLDVKGDNLANIFPFTAIPLPPTPEYEISGHLTKDGDIWTFADFKGAVGHSDLEGTLRYDSTHERPNIQAELTSRLLDRKDLAGFIGAGPAENNKGGQAPASDRVIPDVPINLDRLRAADLDVRLRAEKINDPSLPLENMDARFLLKDGDLKVDPLKVAVASGTITGTLDLDGRQDVPKVTTDLTLAKLSLKSFFTGTRFESLSAGRFGGHVQLVGDGKSLAQVLGTSNGHITVSMSGGQISALMVNAADLDVAKAAVNLLGTDKPTPLRCVVGDFNVQRGLLTSKIFDVDTGLSNIYGTANIDFAGEGLDIEVEGHPKKPSLLAATAPVTITGPMKKPNIGIKGGLLGARGAAAAALGVLLPPLAILPFIQAGVGKDSDCDELIRQAQSRAAEQAQVPDKPPVTSDAPPAISDTNRKPAATP